MFDKLKYSMSETLKPFVVLDKKEVIWSESFVLPNCFSNSFQIHVMARKGDSVSSCLEALFLLRFRHGAGGKVYNSNLVNSKNFLPIHIAAMSLKCPQNTLRLLRQDYEHSLDCRTSDGSLPLHLACQYSSDPNLLIMIISWNKNPTVDEKRNDGFTPLHLVSCHNLMRFEDCYLKWKHVPGCCEEWGKGC